MVAGACVGEGDEDDADVGEADEDDDLVDAAAAVVADALAELIIFTAEFTPLMKSFSGFELVVVCPSAVVAPEAARATAKRSRRCIS